MQEYVYSVPRVVSRGIGVGWVYAYTMTVIMAWIGLRPSKPKPASDQKKSRAGYIAMCLGAIKAKWITAKEMAISGLEDMLKDFYTPAETETLENR